MSILSVYMNAHKVYAVSLEVTRVHWIARTVDKDVCELSYMVLGVKPISSARVARV